MKLSHFVSGSSAVLAGWLAVTFFCHVPAQRYEQHEKSAGSVIEHPHAVAESKVTANQPAGFAFSDSRR
jgi:hypothetical protein